MCFHGIIDTQESNGAEVHCRSGVFDQFRPTTDKYIFDILKHSLLKLAAVVLVKQNIEEEVGFFFLPLSYTILKFHIVFGLYCIGWMVCFEHDATKGRSS